MSGLGLRQGRTMPWGLGSGFGVWGLGFEARPWRGLRGCKAVGFRVGVWGLGFKTEGLEV